MSDHKYGFTDQSICRHTVDTNPLADPTLYNEIIRPTEKKLWVYEGQPCKAKPEDYIVIQL